jgi:hypothetical protein
VRVTTKRIRQFLLTTGDAIDPDTVPDTIQMYNSDGTPFNLDAIMALNASRRDVSVTTAALAAAANTGKLATRLSGGGESGAIDLSVGSLLTYITVSRPCRVRLYTSAAKRDADVARDRFTDPMNLGGKNAVEDHGCLTEFLLLSTLAMHNIPADYLFSETPGDDHIYYRIDNYDLAAGAVTVTLTVKDVER